MEEPEGVCEGNVQGSYIHGLFENHEFTKKYLETRAASRRKRFTFRSFFQKEEMYDRWADVLEAKLDLDLLARIVGQPLRRPDAHKGL